MRSAGFLADDLAGLEARRAHVHALGRATNHGADGLDVRVPAAAGAAMRVRDVVAEARPLAAYVADGSHGLLQSRGWSECRPRGTRRGTAVKGYPTQGPGREPAAGRDASAGRHVTAGRDASAGRHVTAGRDASAGRHVTAGRVRVAACPAWRLACSGIRPGSGGPCTFLSVADSILPL